MTDWKLVDRGHERGDRDEGEEGDDDDEAITLARGSAPGQEIKGNFQIVCSFMAAFLYGSQIRSVGIEVKAEQFKVLLPFLPDSTENAQVSGSP